MIGEKFNILSSHLNIISDLKLNPHPPFWAWGHQSQRRRRQKSNDAAHAEEWLTPAPAEPGGKKRRTALTLESTKPPKSSLLRESSTQSTVRGKYCQRIWYMDRAFCVCCFGSQWKRHDASTHLSCKISVICDNRKYLDFKLFMRYFFLFKGKRVQSKIMQFFFYNALC